MEGIVIINNAQTQAGKILLELECERIVNQEPFITNLIAIGGKPYYVGGFVRDYLMGRPNKDIDIIVEGLNIEQIRKSLTYFGKVDVVGESFAVVKFKSSDTGIEYDIAAPRIDKKVAEGHKGFEVVSGSEVTLEEDLLRRDFRINSIAVDIQTGKIVDPFNGIADIEKRRITMTNPQAFLDDPLRILRAVQFSIRFDFSITDGTFQLMREHMKLIKEIPGERIHEEFVKIAMKNGSAIKTYQLLRQLNFHQYFNSSMQWVINSVQDLKIGRLKTGIYEYNTMGEFFTIICGCHSKAPEFYQEVLKGETSTYKQMKAILFYKKNRFEHPGILASKMVKITNDSFSFTKNVVPDDEVRRYLHDMRDEILPAYVKDLKINGNDAIEAGYEGKRIGDILQRLYEGVIMGWFPNEREKLLELLKLK